MRATMLAAACLVLGSTGCMALQSGFHYPFLHTEYGRTGFAVADDSRSFRFDRAKDLAVLQIKELRLEDQNGDGVVDKVKSGVLEYMRGEPGTEAMFKDMDGLWRDSTAYLSVGTIREKWEEKSADRILDRWLTRPHVR